MPLIQICTHCSTQCNGKYCPDCATADKRRAMDEANIKHFEEQGLPPYVCNACKLETEKRERAKENRDKFILEEENVSNKNNFKNK